MSMTATALLLVLLLVIWLFIRRRQASAEAKAAAPAPVSHQSTAYHAVSIKYASNACQAAREMDGRRFLSTAAPRLPLPECDVLECSCRFVHHKDRRSGSERRSPFRSSGFGGGTGSFAQEKREGADRRKGEDDLL